MCSGANVRVGLDNWLTDGDGDAATVWRDICGDIKSLDFAKRHLTTTITALKRIHMLGMQRPSLAYGTLIID